MTLTEEITYQERFEALTAQQKAHAFNWMFGLLLGTAESRYPATQERAEFAQTVLETALERAEDH